MVASNFQKSYERVLVYEGGWSNHPADPGGATYQGVIQRVYDGYRKRKGLPTRSVRHLTPDEREEIYRTQYWDEAKCRDLPAGIDFVVYDGAVNSGPAQSAKWLQRALGVRADGVIGQATIGAARDHPDHDKVIASICDQRMAFLRALKTWGHFGKGWSRRVASVLKTGQAWAMGSVGPQPDLGAEAEGGSQKAEPADVERPSVSVEQGATTTIGTTSAAGAADKLQEVSTQLAPVADTLEIVKYVLAGIAVIAACLTVYAVYRNYKTNKALAASEVEAI